MVFFENFRTFLDLKFSKCKAIGDFLISIFINNHSKGLFGKYKAKFDFSELIWDSRYISTLALKLPTLCRIESSSKTIFLEVHRANYKFSLWLWKEILTLDSNKLNWTHSRISRSVGWTRNLLPLCFCGCCSLEQHHDFLPYWIERFAHFAKT